MKTFAQKQNQPQKTGSSSFARSNTGILGPNHHANPLLHLQRTIGNQAVQRPLRTSGQELETGLNGMASPLFVYDFSRIPIHPPAAATASVQPSSATQPRRVECARGGDRCPRCVGKEKIDSNALTEPTNALIQRKPRDVSKPTERMPRKEGDKKAELEFHSTIAFNNPNSGSSSTGPSKEGFTVLQIQWVVWNTGFEIAPEHVDRLTIYKADRCSGCRDEQDEILRAEVTAPATFPITQPGEADFRYESISPMVGMTIRAGHYDVYVDLDVYDEVEEINEDNNTIFTSFFVKPRDKSDPDTEGEE
jgi:hypothetical protein